MKQHNNKHIIFTLILLTSQLSTLIACSSNNSSGTGSSPDVTAATLGRKIFFDESLSANTNQSCATCHNPLAGFTDPASLKTSPVSEGSTSGRFGNRNAPTSAYASFSPPFRLTLTPQTAEEASRYEGGQFLDGRSIDLIEQAKGPFLNPLEMNNANEAEVVNKIRNSAYTNDFISVFGESAFTDDLTAYNNVAIAIAAFESTVEMNAFSSRFDAYQDDPLTNPLTASELRGFNLFKDPNTAKCANCHLLENPDSGPALFTNFKYYNIGTPKNPDNPDTSLDLGLGAITAEPEEDGKFKVPTLRNVALTAPYMHNGVYETLEDVVRHYDIQVTNEFIIAEVNRNIAPELNPGSYTSLGLSTQDYADLVAFMEALTDQ